MLVPMEVTGSPELQLQAAVSHPMLALGIGPRPSPRAAMLSAGTLGIVTTEPSL